MRTIAVKKIWSTAIIVLLAVMLTVSFAHIPKVKAVPSYTFSGITSDDSGTQFNFTDGSTGNCTVLTHGQLVDEAVITVGSDFTIAFKPTYVTYDIIDNTSTPTYTSHREYWFNSDENSTETFYVYGPEQPATYTISFLDYTGMLKSYPYVEAQIYSYFLSDYVSVDKRPVDAQNTVSMDLQSGVQYRIVFNDGVNEANNVVYGNLTPASTAGIQLVIRGLEFPQQTLLLYQYVHTYSIRDFLSPLGSITTSYEDTTNKTTSVTLTITNATSNTVAFTQVFVSNNSFTYTWATADNATNYQVTVAIDHQTFGLFNYTQYLRGEYTKALEPFSLEFLGSSTGISTAVIIPALLIIFVAGCFSELTAETAAVLTTIIAILLTALGFIEIPQTALIVALSFSVLAGIVTARKRMQYG